MEVEVISSDGKNSIHCSCHQAAAGVLLIDPIAEARALEGAPSYARQRDPPDHRVACSENQWQRETSVVRGAEPGYVAFVPFSGEVGIRSRRLPRREVLAVSHIRGGHPRGIRLLDQAQCHGGRDVNRKQHVSESIS